MTFTPILFAGSKLRKELIINKMSKTLYIFTGAGNNFVVLDGRKADMTPFRHPSRITELCRRYRTDGLMILTVPSCHSERPSCHSERPSCHSERSEESPAPYDFVMDFFNPDGSGGMMCGNGGRCIVAFANYLGLKPASPDGTWHFLAPDGEHEATILDRAYTSQPSLRDPSRPDGWAPPSYTAEGGHGFGGISPVPKWTVRLKMIDVKGISAVMDGYFLNTGTRHYVQFRDNIDAIDIEPEAKPIRWADEFQPEGTNVNFVEPSKDGLKVRTFEKGVEGETLACGTGITASAIAAYRHGIPDQVGDDSTRHARPGISYRLQCRRGDWLTVEFTPDGTGFKDVFLIGPAELVSLE